MASILNWLNINKKSVIIINSLSETTREGINKAYIPKFLYKPPFGYPRFANMSYVRYLAQTPYVEMCIDTIISEVTSIEWDIIPNKGMEDQEDEAEKEHIKNFFLNPNTNKETFEQVFIEMPVRDLLEINSGILNKVYNLKEDLVEVVARDGATFTKNPDVHGMYTNREDIIINNRIVDNSRQEVVNSYTDITSGAAREQAAYFQYGWIAGPVPIPFGKKEIIWIEKMKRTDDHYGWSAVQTLAKNLQMLLYSIESDLEYYNDNNVPKGIIGLSDSDAEEVEAFKKQWSQSQLKKDEFGNIKKMMNKVPIMNKVPTFTRIEFSSSEMQTIEKQKWYSKMVWACFGVTGVELGYTEDAAGAANQIVQSKVFRKKAINPILRRLESAYNLNIVSEFDYWGEIKTESGSVIKKPKYKFVFKKFDVDEEKSKFELYKLQSESGLKTVNEIRSSEGLEEVEWGDKPPSQFLRSKNSFDFSNNSPTDKPFNEREEDAQNPKKEQDDVEDKAMNQPNPLILEEGERPTGYVKLEKGIKYVLKESEKEIKKIVDLAIGTNVLKQVKDFSGIIAKIKGILSIAALKSFTYQIIKNNYMKGFEDAEKDLNINMLPDQNAIDYISSYTFDNIKGMNDDIAEKLRQVMQRGFMDGKSADALKKDVSAVFDVSDNRVDMIARTETNRAANFGRLHGYMKSGVEGKKVYSAAVDNRTSALCKRLNGQRKNLDEDFEDPNGEWNGPVPPAHPNCRSSWIFKPE